MELEQLNTSGKKISDNGLDTFNFDYETDLADIFMKIKFRIKDLDEVEELRDSYKSLIENCCATLKECRSCVEIEDSD